MGGGAAVAHILDPPSKQCRKPFVDQCRQQIPSFFVYGLLQHHLPYKLFNIIYSMYHETKCRIKFQNGISHDFTSTCGVKQNDVLSPTNFQEEQNLLNTFKPFCNPSLDSDTKIISSAYNRDVTVTSPTTSGWVCPILRSYTRLLIYKLKWDIERHLDIILVSESEEGLQNGLNVIIVLSKFCSSWKLEVNTKKSKIMIFNSNGKSFLNHFKLDNEYFETVKSYIFVFRDRLLYRWPH
jgi:hypothetical protein